MKDKLTKYKVVRRYVVREELTVKATDKQDAIEKFLATTTTVETRIERNLKYQVTRAIPCWAR